MRTIFISLLLLLGCRVLIAEELIVDTENCKLPGRYCDIQTAVNAASESDVVLLAPGRYELWQESITIDKSLTLQGEAAQTTLLLGDGEGPAALINVTPDAEVVTLRNLTVADRIVSGSPTMGPGGLDYRGGDLTLDNVIFKGNRGGWGGAVRIDLLFGTVEIRHSKFIENTGFAGGGVAIYNGSALDLTIENSQFRGNNAIFSGGAVLMRDVAEARFNELQIIDNSAGNTGGGVHVFTDTGTLDLLVEDSVIKNNEAAKVGGLSTFGADVSVALKNSVIDSNRSRQGLMNADCGGVPFELLGNNVIGQPDRCQK